MPLFTIATVTYNSAKWVRHTIESVLASSFEDFEYIIADDGSTDETWQIVQEYNDPRIKASRNEPNIGEYNNRNKVLNAAKGDFILYIDGDDIIYRETLRDYAGYIHAFPDTCGVWGVYTLFFDFLVFPYQLTPLILSRFNFLSTIPITIVGLTETVFKTSALKQIGGFDASYATADTHAKKRFSCLFPVVLAPAGKAFWRQSPDQIESFTMDKDVIYSENFPLKGADLEQAKFNFRNRRIKLVVSNTLLKWDIYNFFRLMNTLKIPFTDIVHLFKKASYTYNADANGTQPLMTDFNFKRSPVAAKTIL